MRGKRATLHWWVVPLLSQFDAMPVNERFVRDGNIITAAGVSAGLDFGSALVAELRGRPMAEATTLITEYAPEPPFPGTVEAARPEIAKAAAAMLQNFVANARSLKLS